MKYLFLTLLCVIVLTTLSPAQDHAAFTSILENYVLDGKVNYRELCKDNRLDTYIAQLAATDPDTIQSQKAKLAFWLNAYNAYTLKVICDNYPLESINELHTGGLYIGTILNMTIWDKNFVVIDNQRISLNHIEHEIVRKRFKDPRAHFALVCASKSCPPLRPEAYEGSKLEEQLDEQGRIFFADSSKNFFDTKEKQAHLSKILDWFSGDFGKDDMAILRYVARFLPADLAAAINTHPKEWDIKYTKYDWSLNE